MEKYKELAERLIKAQSRKFTEEERTQFENFLREEDTRYARKEEGRRKRIK